MKKQLASAFLFFGAAVVTAIGLHVTVRTIEDEKNMAEFASEDAPHNHEKALFKKGEPWFGGKPHARINVAGKVRRISNEAFELSYEVQPQETCDEFIVRVRGIDGVQFEQEQLTSQSCAVKLSEAIVVQVPEGGAGYIVFDIQMVGGHGDSRGMSRSFFVDNGGSAPKTQATGVIEKSGGKAFHVMKGQ